MGVSALAVVLLLQQVSVAQLGTLLGRADPLWMAVIVLVGMGGGLLARAARWQVYFLPERRVPFRPLLSTLAISYMASTFLPFRMGEVVRAAFLAQREALPFPRVVGTILLEKLFDFLALAVLLLVLLAASPPSDVVRLVGAPIATAILAGFGFVVALAVWREPTLRLVRLVERLLPFGLGRRVGLAKAVAQFAAGTDSLRVGRLWPAMLGWTGLAWVAAFAAVWAGAAALGQPLGWPALFFWLVLTSTGQAVPSSPGYVGVYHAAAVAALAAYGVETSTALAMAVLTHALSYGGLVVMGLIAMWADGYGLGDLLAGARGAAQAPPTPAAPASSSASVRAPAAPAPVAER